jgi:hypothetical protein
MVDAADSKSVDREVVGVRVPPGAPRFSMTYSVYGVRKRAPYFFEQPISNHENMVLVANTLLPCCVQIAGKRVENHF